MILFVFIFSLLFTVFYNLLIREYLLAWHKTKFPASSDVVFKSKVSVIVAVYNESKNIESCVHSILNNRYPSDLFEVIIVDNGSKDDTWEILNSIQDDRLVLLQEKDGYKKEALEAGISRATGDFLLFTDGDCFVQEFWVESMVTPFEIEDIRFVLGPVCIDRFDGVVERFQSIDMLAMMGVTAGGLGSKMSYLSNGANMAFAKSFYTEIGGIPRKDIASGDDVFMLHEFVKKYPDGVQFMKSKEAIVSTKAENSLSDLVHQRIRWASKTVSYVHQKDKFVAAFIFLFCLLIWTLPFLGLFMGISLVYLSFGLLLIKAIIDYRFIKQIDLFFKLEGVFKLYPLSFLIHFTYILFSGITGLIGVKYRWRGKEIL